MRAKKNKRIAVYGCLLAVVLGIGLAWLLEKHAGFTMNSALLTGGFVASIGLGLAVMQKDVISPFGWLLFGMSISQAITCFVCIAQQGDWYEATIYGPGLGLIFFWFMAFVFLLLKLGVSPFEPNGWESQ